MNAEKSKRPSASQASRENWDCGQADLEVVLDEYYEDQAQVDWDALEAAQALFADRYDEEQES